MSLREKIFDDHWKLSAFIFGVIITLTGSLVWALFFSPFFDRAPQTAAEVAPAVSSEPSPTASASPSEAAPTTSTTPTTSPSATPSLATPTESAAPGGGSIFLTELKPVNQPYQISDGVSVEVGGEIFPNSIRHWPNGSSRDFLFTEYNLSKKYSKFTATIGVNDEAEQGDQVGLFIVYVDGNEVGRWESRLGAPQKIEVPVSGAQRIRLETGPASVDKPQYSDLVWGTPRLHP